MSFFLSAVHPDRVEVITDGASYSRRGTVLRFSYKVEVSPYVPLIVTGRGSVGQHRHMANAIIELSRCGSVDHTLAELRDYLARHRDDARAQVDRLNYEILIAAWSESHGPSHSHFSTADYSGQGLPPMTLRNGHQLPTFVIAGHVMTDDDYRTVGLTPETYGLGASHWGRPLMEWQRNKCEVNPLCPEMGPLHLIGGHADLTVVTSGEVETSRLVTWPDRRLRRIDPFRKEADTGMQSDSEATTAAA